MEQTKRLLQEFGIEDSDFVVLQVGSFGAEVGDNVIATFRSLELAARKSPERQLHLLVIDAPTAAADIGEIRVASKFSPSVGIHFIPRTDKHRISACMDVADVFFSLSTNPHKAAFIGTETERSCVFSDWHAWQHQIQSQSNIVFIPTIAPPPDAINGENPVLPFPSWCQYVAVDIDAASTAIAGLAEMGRTDKRTAVRGEGAVSGRDAFGEVSFSTTQPIQPSQMVEFADLDPEQVLLDVMACPSFMVAGKFMASGSTLRSLLGMLREGPVTVVQLTAQAPPAERIWVLLTVSWLYRVGIIRVKASA